MDFSAPGGRNYISGKAQERRLRAPTLAYLSDTHDLYIATTQSYKEYFRA